MSPPLLPKKKTKLKQINLIFGSDFKMMVIESSMDDTRFNFLRNSADGYHALFEKKLAQFRLADPGYEDYHRKFVECYVLYRKGVTDVSDGMDIKVFHAPPEVRQATIVDKVAFLVSKYAWEFKLLVMGSNTKDPRFEFLMASPEDPIQVSYQRRLSRYCFQNHDKVPRLAPYTQSKPRVQSQRLVLPNLLQCRLLKGMTFTELDTVKVTAQFVAWYGDAFRGKLMERVMMDNQFEFMKQTDYMFAFFTAYMNTVLEGFLERILWIVFASISGLKEGRIL